MYDKLDVTIFYVVTKSLYLPDLLSRDQNEPILTAEFTLLNKNTKYLKNGYIEPFKDHALAGSRLYCCAKPKGSN